jgi:hypothetical protein
MKKLLFIVCSLFLFSSCEKFEFERRDKCKCEKVVVEKVPTVIISSFKTKYPEAQVDVWYKISKKEYAAAFKTDIFNTAYFDTDGNHLKTKENKKEVSSKGEDHDDDDDDCDCDDDDDNEEHGCK